jgi:uncharacterized protein YbaR (Trm112 family)
MFTPLVDILRCPNAHEETWLVASIDRAEARDILEGTLGCPICLAEYPIRAGVVRFAEVVVPAPIPLHENDAVRLAAALDLTDARMTALLHGDWGTLAPILRGESPAQLLLVNPPAGIASGDGVSIVTAEIAPVAHGSVDAVAVGADASGEMLASLVASLKASARVVGPIALVVPEGLTELVRDDEIWVAQLQAPPASGPVPLARGGRRPHE